MSAEDDALTGDRWAEAQRWIDRQVQASALAHPEIPAEDLEAMAASAYGYATAPGYPSDDRDEIFGQMLRSATAAEARECGKSECGHWESGSPAFYGHCSHASCPNYMEACPAHQTPVLKAAWS